MGSLLVLVHWESQTVVAAHSAAQEASEAVVLTRCSSKLCKWRQSHTAGEPLLGARMPPLFSTNARRAQFTWGRASDLRQVAVPGACMQWARESFNVLGSHVALVHARSIGKHDPPVCTAGQVLQSFNRTAVGQRAAKGETKETRSSSWAESISNGRGQAGRTRRHAPNLAAVLDRTT